MKAGTQVPYLIVVNHDLVSSWVNGLPPQYDVAYGVCDAKVSEPKADDFLMCEVQVILIFNG